MAALTLGGCGADKSKGSDSSSPPSLPGSGTTNRPPTISGQPPATAKANVLYDFTPTASDPDGDTLRFEIAGRPSWATFNPNTGRLYGTPSTTGTFAGIQIAVTDGTTTVGLPSFTVTVTQTTTTGSAELSWTPPTRNTDGTPLTNLGGYKVYYGPAPGSLTQVRDISDASARSTTIGPLASGTWYFALSVYTTDGVESSRTWPVSKTI